MPKASTAKSKKLLVIAAVVVVALCVLWWSHRERFEGSEETIFVSVASYRDGMCSKTIKNLFENADKPARVFVGVCEQNDSASPEEACVPAALPAHVRRITIPHLEAKGPTYARYLCSTLYMGETWFCQIDSHTRFAKGWDTMAINNARACPSKKPILTHYPRRIEEYGAKDRSVPVLCKSKFDGHGVPTFESIIMEPPKDGVPRAVPFVSGGFVFMPGTAVHEVPFDPDLPHLFQGEEILHSARLWTAGYDFFTPLDNIVFHEYERKGKPKFWEDVKEFHASQDETLRKVRRLLGLEQPPLVGYPYAMGQARSLEDYWKFAGIDILKKTSQSEGKFCSA